MLSSIRYSFHPVFIAHLSFDSFHFFWKTNFERKFYLCSILFDTSAAICNAQTIKLCFSYIFLCYICLLFNEYSYISIFTIRCFQWRRLHSGKNRTSELGNVSKTFPPANLAGPGPLKGGEGTERHFFKGLLFYWLI